MISKTMRAILHTLSYGNIEVESSADWWTLRSWMP